MSAIDILSIAEPVEPARKRTRKDEPKPHEVAPKEAPKAKPNVWYHPISRVDFDFATNDDKPEIHVKNHGPVPLTVVGHMGGNSLLQDPIARFVTTTASVRIYEDEDTLNRLRVMIKAAAEWIVINKSDLDKDWKKVLKLMQNTNSIKNNSNLVFFNFMVRHGLINSKLEKNYEKILRF